MPLRSQSQAKWMFANHPAMAKRWAAETPSIKALPKKVASGSKFVPLKKGKR
jgi:hypothetical protein